MLWSSSSSLLRSPIIGPPPRNLLRVKLLLSHRAPSDRGPLPDRTLSVRGSDLGYDRPMPERRVTLKDLESELRRCAETLRGPAVDRIDGRGYPLPLLFFKQISDVWDEQATSGILCMECNDVGCRAALVPDLTVVGCTGRTRSRRMTVRLVGVEGERR